MNNSSRIILRIVLLIIFLIPISFAGKVDDLSVIYSKDEDMGICAGCVAPIGY